MNVICRRLANNPNARILITAPTNYAVTVLAERFLNVVNSGEDEDDLMCKCNAVLIGVEEKLVATSSSEYISVESKLLRSIYVYTWAETMKEDCQSLLTCMKDLHSTIQSSNIPFDSSFDTLVAHAERIKTKICMSIPSASGTCCYAKSLLHQLEAISGSMHNMSNDFGAEPQLEIAISHAENLVESLDDMESPVAELLATARVIFCTLSTAGSSIMKQTRRIDDLLIDEAACATEAEICIPFHLRPQRMLGVGDRKFI